MCVCVCVCVSAACEEQLPGVLLYVLALCGGSQGTQGREVRVVIKDTPHTLPTLHPPPPPVDPYECTVATPTPYIHTCTCTLPLRVI
jgi:hypothetical protein